jgi:ribosomal protein S18 acetylase RimI-like enzyme
MIVRSAKREDFTGVLQIDELSFPNPWGREFLENISKEIFLVSGEQEVYGFLIAGCRHRNVSATLLKIAVHPVHRRKGIATNLINKLMEILRDRQITEVEVVVLKTCDPAISLYKKAGFKLESTIPQASNNDDLWVMKLELTKD